MISKKSGEKEIPVDFPEDDASTTVQENDQPSDGRESGEKVSSHKNKHEKDSYKKKYNDLNQKYTELNEQFLRLRAEFANYKKRVEREQLELADYIKGEFIKKLLPILDDFKHMLEKSGDNANEKSVLEGAKMIYDKFYQILRNEGLERIEALGKDFDPQIHEAMMMQKTDKPEEHHKVLSVFQDGYKLKDRLIRPSKVVVGMHEDNN